MRFSFAKLLTVGSLYLCYTLIMIIVRNYFNECYKLPKEDIIRMKIKEEVYEKISDIDIEAYDNMEFYNNHVQAICVADKTFIEIFNKILNMFAYILSTGTLLTYIVDLSPAIVITAIIGCAFSLMANFYKGNITFEREREITPINRKISYIDRVYSLPQYAKDMRVENIKKILENDFEQQKNIRNLIIKKYGFKNAFTSILFQSPLEIADMFMWLYIGYDKYKNRIAGTQEEKKAAKYIFDYLKEIGYEVRMQKFFGLKDGKLFRSQNVLAYKQGEVDDYIIVGAHYDSVETNGIDDNASGVAICLETARRIFVENIYHSVVFVFFGSEEYGTYGAKSFLEMLSEEQKNKIYCIVNVDTILCGTYCYAYSGKYNAEMDVVEHSWPFEIVKIVSDFFEIDLRDNNSEYNYRFHTPACGKWGDHGNFMDEFSYLCLEATNWEILDDMSKPELGSSGLVETEIGTIRHNKNRDNMDFILKNFKTRMELNLTNYSILLYFFILCN